MSNYTYLSANDTLAADTEDNIVTTVLPDGPAVTYLKASFLLLYGLAGLLFHAVVSGAFLRHSAAFIGFRYMACNCASDALLLLQFAIWPSIVILLQRRMFPDSFNFAIHIWMDGVWFTDAYYQTLIAYTRLQSVWNPTRYYTESHNKSMMFCAAPWLIGFVQSIISHYAIPDFVIMYLDPKAGGLVFDGSFEKYTKSATPVYYSTFNLMLIFVLPLLLYSVTIVRFVKLKRKVADHLTQHSQMPLTNVAPQADARAAIPQPSVRRGSATSRKEAEAAKSTTVERNLILPCIISNVIYVAGQVILFTPYISPWWVLVVFTTKSVSVPILYFVYSVVIRDEILVLFMETFDVSFAG